MVPLAKGLTNVYIPSNLRFALQAVDKLGTVPDGLEVDEITNALAEDRKGQNVGCHCRCVI